MRSRILFLTILATGCGRLGFDSEFDPSGDGGVAGKPQPPTTGLVAYWQLEDAGANGALSSVSSDRATCSGTECPTADTGAVGRGARFDGTNTCYHVPSLIGWGAPTYTISAWVKVDTIAADQPVVMRYNGGCPSPSLRTHQDTVAFTAYDTLDIHHFAWTSGGLGAQGWQQLALRWDGTMQSLFVDGQCMCNVAPPNPLVVAPDTEFTIGCDMNDGKRFSGAIDEVRVYDRALDDAEMATLAGVGDYAVPPTTACAATCAVTDVFP